MKQYDLFSAIAVAVNQEDVGGEQLKEEGMKAALDAAGMQWRANAIWKLKNLCLDQEYVCADDMDGYENPKHKNAMGGLFREASSRGWIEPSGLPDSKSKIPRKHSRKIPIWKSLLHND